MSEQAQPRCEGRLDHLWWTELIHRGQPDRWWADSPAEPVKDRVRAYAVLESLEAQVRVEWDRFVSEVLPGGDADIRLASETGSSPLARKESPPAEREACAANLVGDLGQDVAQLVRELQALLRGKAYPEAPLKQTRALVYAHGFESELPLDTEAWWLALSPHLPLPLRTQLQYNRRDVTWDDLLDQVADEQPLDLAGDHELLLATQIRDVLEDRAERQRLEQLPVQPEGIRPVAAPPPSRQALPALTFIQHIVRYLADDTIRDRLQQRFLSVIVPLLESGASVEVISHGWGSVVTYEALRTLDAQEFPGRVHNLFTVGSPLSMVPVQRRLQCQDGQRPQHVQRWINLEAEGDLVGGALTAFQVDLEYLNLYPTGCDRIARRASALCAHRSYFLPANVAVNEGIFALHIQA